MDKYLYMSIVDTLPHGNDIALAMEFAEAVMRLYADERPDDPLTSVRRYQALWFAAHAADAHMENRRRYDPDDLRRDLREAIRTIVPEAELTQRIAREMPATAARFYAQARGW